MTDDVSVISLQKLDSPVEDAETASSTALSLLTIPKISVFTLQRIFYVTTYTMKRRIGYTCIGDTMSVKDAVVQRLDQLCAERQLNYNALATISGITPSTVYSLMKTDYRDLTVVTLKKLCDGLEITLGEFFSTPEFDALEQEIK